MGKETFEIVFKNVKESAMQITRVENSRKRGPCPMSGVETSEMRSRSEGRLCGCMKEKAEEMSECRAALRAVW